MKKLAYIGVDGEKYRIMIPVEKVILERIENGNKTFVFDGPNALIGANARLGTDSVYMSESDNYIKYQFQVFWKSEKGKDAPTYRGRYDLEKDDWNANLGHQMCSFLNNHGTEDAKHLLDNYETMSMAVPADDSYMVVWDFRKNKTDIHNLQKMFDF